MIDFTTLEANPIPPPISELQKQNVILNGKNKVFEKIIIGAITAGALVLIYYVIKTSYPRDNEKD
jgi:hypothetical protein